MRRALVVLALLATTLVPVTSATEAQACATAPVPTRAPEAADVATGILPAAEAGATHAGAPRADARVNVTGLARVGVTSVEAILKATWTGGDVHLTGDYAYTLVGTRSVTCFTWPAFTDFPWRSVHVWANATTGDSVALDVWIG